MEKLNVYLDICGEEVEFSVYYKTPKSYDHDESFEDIANQCEIHSLYLIDDDGSEGLDSDWILYVGDAQDQIKEQIKESMEQLCEEQRDLADLEREYRRNCM